MRKWAVAYSLGVVSCGDHGDHLLPDERFAVSVSPVRYATAGPDEPERAWRPRPGSRSLRLPFLDDGTVVATNRRLYMVKSTRFGFYDVHREWQWSDIESLRTTSKSYGVALTTADKPSEMQIVGHVFHRLLARPGMAKRTLAWSKVVGAWMDSRGLLDTWLASLDAGQPTPPD